MPEPTLDANQPSSSQGTDANQQAAASSPPAPSTSDTAYQSGLQAAINKGLGTPAPSQRAEEPATEPAVPAPTEDEPKPQTPPQEGQEPLADPTPGEEEAPADPTQEDKKDVPYERFSEVIAEKNAALEQMQQLEPAVRDYQQILGYLEHNNLEATDFQWALRLAAAKKNNPEVYMQMLQPDIAQLGQMKGEVLDPDLKAAVENAEISQQWAEKVQASRAQQSFQQRNAQAQHEAQRRQQAIAYQSSMANSITDWSKAKQTSDTEFQPNKKGGIGLYETFAAHLRMAAESQTPTTPEQMKALCEKVYASVKPLFRSSSPKTNGVHVRTNQTTSPHSVRKIETINDALTAAVEHSNRLVLRGGR